MCVCLYSFFNFSLLLGVFSSIAVGYFNGVLSVLYIVILLLLCTHSHIHFSLALLLSLPYSLIFFLFSSSIQKYFSLFCICYFVLFSLSLSLESVLLSVCFCGRLSSSQPTYGTADDINRNGRLSVCMCS